MTIFDFNKECNLEDWRVIDDIVMGGRSNGQLRLNNRGHGVFFGKGSLENNGGFSSVRYNFDTVKPDIFTKIEIRLKGDGKQYQFRVKSNKFDRHSYVYDFQTSGDWETISIPFSNMHSQFRGRKLNMPNYPAKMLEEFAILISNKKEESFILEIDKIFLN
tara:strand:+ start:709 stop:1191 length:483 start_codon:yes stop_codon:yes gene_type:complete